MDRTLTAFLKPNVAQVQNARFTPSTRFKGVDGKPLEWEICCISADEYAGIRSSCMNTVPVSGKKKNRFTQEFDARAFQTKLAARCTVFPDLNDAELQNSWGVLRPEDLIGVMLTAGEFEDYVAEILRVNGFQTEAELVDDAKN